MMSSSNPVLMVLFPLVLMSRWHPAIHSLCPNVNQQNVTQLMNFAKCHSTDEHSTCRMFIRCRQNWWTLYKENVHQWKSRAILQMLSHLKRPKKREGCLLLAVTIAPVFVAMYSIGRVGELLDTRICSDCQGLVSLTLQKIMVKARCEPMWGSTSRLRLDSMMHWLSLTLAARATCVYTGAPPAPRDFLSPIITFPSNVNIYNQYSHKLS